MLECEINPSRKYIQFNNLIIDNYDMITRGDLSYGFKTETVNRSFGHGSYVVFKNNQQYVTEQTLSLSLNLDYRKLRRDQKKFYKDYIRLNIMKPGKLWAIEGEDILWAQAFVQDVGEPYEMYRNTLSIDLTFIIYEGVWHKADKHKIFLEPYDPCNFIDYDCFQEIDDCLGCCEKCSTNIQNNECDCCFNECEYLNKENSLCALKDKAINEFYETCANGYRIIYNCKTANKLWGKDMLGHRICKEEYCNAVIAGKFYSGTIVDTGLIEITLTGPWVNPTISINKIRMKTIGEYDGTLTITKSGEVYYQKDECCPPIKLDIELLIPLDGQFGWEVHHGVNTVIVEGGCCGMGCIYIKVDELTI